jgi:lysyl-tRNA synthetase class 1
LRYGAPESLILLMLKRLAYARVVDLEEIPKLMDEVNYLEDVYFGKEKVKNEKERAHLRRLYEYVKLLDIPEGPSLSVPYNVIANIASVIPEDTPNRDDIIINILQNSKKAPTELADKDQAQLERLIGYATEWVKDAGTTMAHEPLELSDAEREALRQLVDVLDEDMEGEEIQNAVFSTAQEHDLKPAKFFKLLYYVLLGVQRGPRAGTLIKTIGVQRACEIIEREIDASLQGSS